MQWRIVTSYLSTVYICPIANAVGISSISQAEVQPLISFDCKASSHEYPVYCTALLSLRDDNYRKPGLDFYPIALDPQERKRETMTTYKANNCHRAVTRMSHHVFCSCAEPSALHLAPHLISSTESAFATVCGLSKDTHIRINFHQKVPEISDGDDGRG